MIFKLLSAAILLFSVELLADVTLKVEAGIYLPTIEGSITNTVSKSTFENDFGYGESSASYLGAALILDYDYVPNFEFGYFNMQDNKNAALTQNVTVADGNFSSDVSTVIDYQVFNFLIYQDFKIKGPTQRLLGRDMYFGDLEFDIGLNSKVYMWNYEVQDMTDLTKSSSWINVQAFIPLPYLGVKYYFYDLVLYSNVSALAFSSDKSTSYQIGADYNVVAGLYLSAAYMHDEFKAVELADTVEFSTSGYKFGFKYSF